MSFLRSWAAMPLVALVAFACDGDNTEVPPGSSGGPPDGGVGVCVEDPLSETCLNDEKATIFALPSGSDVLGTGTRARPVKSLEHALTLLTPDRRRVYLGDGAPLREENGTVDPRRLGTQQAGLTLVGGLDGSGKPNGGHFPIVELIVTGPLDAPIVLHGLELTPKSATDSTVARVPAALVVDRAEVHLRNVVVSAPNGGNGADGKDARPADPPSGKAGVPHRPPMGAIGGVNNCAAQTGSGGGNAAASGTPTTNANAGADGVACASGGDGKDGTAGADGVLPGAGGQRPRFQDLGGVFGFAYQQTNGEDGKPGQGGGGGGSGSGGTGTGGGGGAGGCPGLGGEGGFFGGASIGIVVTNGKLVVRASQITTGNGGNGGKGGAGKEAQPVSELYPGGAGTNGGCTGGKGAKGGRGRSGGGGAGGSSIGILAGASTVDADDATKTASKQGTPGKGGAGLENNSGVDGVAVFVANE